jgi:hypothetical protein
MAIQWEEKDLVAIHGSAYKDYQQQVPMLLPRFFRGNLMRNKHAVAKLPA